MLSYDRKKYGPAISASIMSNPKERKRRSDLMKKLATEYAKKLKSQGIPAWNGYGIGHKKTPSELVMLGLFPNAKHNLVITTGQSSKLGHTQQYWLDIAWPEIKLNVEIDGSYHFRMDQREHDCKKDSFLKGKGWTVLRFSDQSVIKDTTAVKAVIESTISKLKATQATA